MGFKVLRVFAILGLWLCQMAAVSPVHAQQFLEEFKKPLADIPVPAPAEFEKATFAFGDAPYNDKGLAYDMRIPNGWEQSHDTGSMDAMVGTKILGELLRFYGKPVGDTRSYLTIQALNLDYYLSAEQWFIQYMLSNSYTLQGMKVIDERRVEGIYVFVEKDVQYAVRTLALINGKRVLLVRYFLPIDQWEVEKSQQAAVMHSFKVRTPINEYVEEMEKYHFLDISELRYPTSWKLQVDPLKTIDKLRIELLNITQSEEDAEYPFSVMNGKITVDLVSFAAVSSLPTQIAEMKVFLEGNNLKITEFVEDRKDFNFNKSLQSSPVEVYKMGIADKSKVKGKLVNYELWFYVLESGGFYYFSTLLTPTRDDDYFMWSRNTQTFRLIGSTILPQQGALINHEE